MKWQILFSRKIKKNMINLLSAESVHSVDLTLHADWLQRKCQILFSRNNKTNIINLSSAESANSVVSVKSKLKHGLLE